MSICRYMFISIFLLACTTNSLVDLTTTGCTGRHRWRDFSLRHMSNDSRLKKHNPSYYLLLLYTTTTIQNRDNTCDERSITQSIHSKSTCIHNREQKIRWNHHYLFLKPHPLQDRATETTQTNPFDCRLAHSEYIIKKD